MQSVLITGASSGPDRLTMETFARRSFTRLAELQLAELHERGGRGDPSWEERAAAAHAFGTSP